MMFIRELSEGWVNDVFGKYPSPFDNPTYTELEEQYDRNVWAPLLAASTE
ncbi:hypothetical protein K2X30_13110 [bacterium]|nr:hypothetical protein [bacterium]